MEHAATINYPMNRMTDDEYFDRWMHRAGKKIKSLRATNRTLTIYLITTIAICIGITACAIYGMSKFMEMSNQIETLQAENQMLQEEISARDAELAMMKDQYIDLYDENEILRSNNEELGVKVQSLVEVNDTLSQENENLLIQADEYKAAAEEYAERSELYDKYSYAILRKDGTRTDITYDQLRSAETLMEEKGVDVDLVLSMIMVESNGKEKAQSATSTARGYGQFLKGTGKFVYEELMEAGNYSHNYALDGDTNIEMVATYMSYLTEKNNSLVAAIQGYRGEGGAVLQNYIAKIDRYLAKKDKSVAMLSRG